MFRLSWGQHTGLICEPGWEAEALTTLADYLQQMPWSRLTLEYCSASQRRRNLFLESFDANHYRVSYGRALMNGGTVDNLVCPHVRLPDDFDTYLQTRVSSNTRQKIRRFSRRIERSSDLRLTDATSETFDQDLKALLDLWSRKWTPRRGAAKVQRVIDKYREILAQSQACQAVHLPVLWRGETPLGALANIVDWRKRHAYFIVAGRQETVSDPFIGLALHAHSISWAIDQKLDIYDFCHGNEPYKYSFGATDKRLTHLTIRREPNTTRLLLDPAHVREAVDRTIDFTSSNDALAAFYQLNTLGRSHEQTS